MPPQHDEVKQLEDGFVIVWDTTRVARAKLQEMRDLGATQAANLSRIIGAGDAPAPPHQPPQPTRR